MLAKHVQQFSYLDLLYMFSMLLWMGWLAFRVGQMSFLILGATVLVILLIGKGRSILSGLLIPLLLIKPPPLHYLYSSGTMVRREEDSICRHNHYLAPF